MLILTYMQRIVHRKYKECIFISKNVCVIHTYHISYTLSYSVNTLNKSGTFYTCSSFKGNTCECTNDNFFGMLSISSNFLWKISINTFIVKLLFSPSQTLFYWLPQCIAQQKREVMLCLSRGSQIKWYHLGNIPIEKYNFWNYTCTYVKFMLEFM